MSSSEGFGDNGMPIAHTRQQAGAGPSRAAAVGRGAARGRQRAATARRALQERQQDVIDLTDDRADDDDVQITRVKIAKRPRLRSPGGAAALAAPAQAVEGQVLALPMPVPMLLPALAATDGPAAPPAPPSPKGYKCVICLERMEGDMATTTCGHMFCYKCISSWLQKNNNCPQCRTKLNKNKIIRIYPPS